MTDLSPAARTIVQAFDERHELLGPLEGNWQEVCLAAALRAAADQLGYRIIYDYAVTDYKVDVADLLAIAAELESL